MPERTNAEDRKLSVRPPHDHAAGMEAVAVALRHAQEQMGVVRSFRALRRLNQPDGFDCPGCAWPEPGHTHVAEFCENGAKAVAEEATRKRVDPDFFARHPVAELADWTDYQLGRSGRLTHPMVLRDGASHYAPISWEEAYGLIAQELNALPTPDEAIFYTSGRTSNEAAFAYQAFVRAYGTNNLPDCSNMCHESSGVALTETIGIGKGSVTLEDVEHADLLLIVGQNPGTNHPRMLSALEAAKGNGATIVSINPLPEAGLIRFKNPQTPKGMLGHGTALADHWLQVRVNGDLALFQALSKLLLDAEAAAPGTVLDHAFIEAHTDGFEAWSAALQQLDWDAVLAATGLRREEIELVAELAIRSERTVVCWAMGITQHKNAVATIREFVSFLLLRGNIGRPGAGVCPVRGHSNVQGDRTMGIYEKPAPAFLERLHSALGFAPPQAHGLDAVEAIRAMRDGRAHVFFAMGGNFASAAPDTDATFAALRACRLTVHVSTKLNRSHVVHGTQALILPTLGRTELDMQARGAQAVTVEDSMGMVHHSRGTLAPASEELRSEVAIVAGLARAVLGPVDGGRAGADLPWERFAGDYRLLRQKIEQVVPGFERFEQRIAQPGGFALPHPPRDSRTFPTTTGKARFLTNPLTCVTVPEGRLVLQTLRSHDQYNTTIYGLNDRYRGVKAGRRVVFLSARDIEQLGFAEGDVVDLIGEAPDGIERRADRFRIVSYDTPRGCAAAYYPETNPLVPLDSTADGSNQPASKSVIVRLQRSAA
ncbi:FdhF/YdeP family oxidoreductase [Conexibacter sp. JD483]|uniref:FdhF/YdeP family oxidoreductase n=1 Tax=unclassified Conexibacter TaxID=2627773 RepID=UPI00271C97DF|nr:MULTISPECIES: FdhF/YdeP family oxidoreductase [unclassified Conexibacter]MDO8186400.1 FdhF/YdeP family oxidoreductase [Conexibacter sp. CPCC 205706]MDO8199799.1 FdhF/YdeP family oxidoreductase [Conexibacter sp. CPCC 205762]MDR9369181.1 FdhF/YdeP family oxidoreductase [Conexibacter sp. JD483]